MVITSSYAQIGYPGIDPGNATIRFIPESSIQLENNVVIMKFNIDGRHIKIEEFKNKDGRKQTEVGQKILFKINLADGKALTSDEFILKNQPEVINIPAEHDAVNYGKRFAGKKIAAEFENRKIGLDINWEVVLRDDASYIRQFLTIKAADTIDIRKIILLEFPEGTGIKKCGTVDGSPLTNGNMFFAIEHPMGQTESDNGFVTQFMVRLTPFIPGEKYTLSTVWGITPENQLRRGFLYYSERERSAPYHQVLHYNSWYDISWADIKFNEAQALDRIRTFRDSLITKRKVPLDAYLFDDGWDDEKTLWQFNKTGFPDGFSKLKTEAGSGRSEIGVWMSPFGGYGIAKEKRLEYGKKQVPPFENNANGFSLSGVIYYQRFLEVARKFIRDYDVAIFKFDGVGPGNDASGAGIAYHNDIEAFLKLLTELKEIKPALYLDLTTGTWPSVYWLFYGDNTWRSGDDNGLAGEGPLRQQGITYRDANTFKNVVKAGPLYPLTALMNGGIIIGDHGLPGKFEMDEKNISDDIWSFFGTGVSLEELYVNPHKLSQHNWDCLAKAAMWAKENEHIMPDTHWIGGDPGLGEVYGYAAWSPERSVLMLRNPSGVVKSFLAETEELFEIPVRMEHYYQFFDARAGNRDPTVEGEIFKTDLKPFEVKVFTCFPQKRVISDNFSKN